jgi:hypothetical protein
MIHIAGMTNSKLIATFVEVVRRDRGIDNIDVPAKLPDVSSSSVFMMNNPLKVCRTDNIS